MDRKGETAEGKRKDFWWSLLVSIVLSGFAYFYAGIGPLQSIALLIAWRVLLFDYLVTYLLIKNDVIVGHWFTYTGKTSRWDKIISKVNPWVRLSIRIALFVLSVLLFLQR